MLVTSGRSARPGRVHLIQPWTSPVHVRHPSRPNVVTCHGRRPPAKDPPDAPHEEEVPARPSVPSRTGRPAGRRCVRQRVLGGEHRPGLLPGGDGQHLGGRDVGTRRRQAGRERHPAAVRRHPRRPVPSPGLRPGAGPVLGDGRPPAHHLRAALGDVRIEPGRDRHLPADHGLAPGRAAGVRHQALRRHQEEPAGLLGRRERLACPAPGRCERLAGVHAARRGARRLQARAVEPGRLGRLAEGDGLEPLRQPAGGDRPLAAVPGLHRGQDRPALPGLPVRPQRHHREADRHGRRGRDVQARRRLRRGADAARTGPGHHQGADAGPLGQHGGHAAAARPAGPGDRLQLLGGQRFPHHHRQAAAGQRPAPRPRAALGLVPDGPALPDGRRPVSYTHL